MGRIAVAAAVAVLATACSSGAGSTADAPDLRGHRLEVLAVWTGAEQEAFEGVLRGFEKGTGADVTYTPAGHGVASALNARLSANGPPDVAFLPQPGLLRRYAEEGRLVPLDDVLGGLVERNYGPIWRELGSFDGRLYGVWFKAANKSLIWYNVAVFERLGVVPPEDLDGLLGLARTMASAGLPAFAVGGADGWTLTDWFENLYLRRAGPDRYDRLARHDLPWTDESVKATLRLLSVLLDDGLVVGGTDGALATDFEGSVQQVFTEPAAAAMTSEGDFVAGAVTSLTDATPGVDAEVFAFPRLGPGPGRTDERPAVVGGGDAAVLLRRSAAGVAFLRYLASADAAGPWATRGGFLSPNRNVELSVYPDDVTRALARSLLEAGDAFRFDLSDLAPAAFGGTEGQGVRAGLQEFLRTRDVEATAISLEAQASAAFGS